MFSHAFLGSNDMEKSKRFYDATMGALGYQPASFGPAVAYPSDSGVALVIGPPRNGEAATAANGHTLGFVAKSSAEVDAFHAAGLANGGSCEGVPGVRPSSPGQQYGAYLRDPDGNKICAFAPNPNSAG